MSTIKLSFAVAFLLLLCGLVCRYCFSCLSVPAEHLDVPSQYLPQDSQQSTNPAAPPPPPTCYFDRDNLSYPTQSRVFSKLSQEGALALVALANAQYFCTQFESARGGLDSGRALRILGREDKAAEAFAELLTLTSSSAQLYGLIGLYHADPIAFRREAARYETLSNTMVPVISDCLVSDEPISSLVRSKTGRQDIWSGDIPRHFLEGILDNENLSE